MIEEIRRITIMLMIISIVCFALNLAACATQIPIAQRQETPAVPTTLLQPCESLETITGARLVDIVDTVLNNYHAYYNCADKVQAWQDWYSNINKKVSYDE